MKPAVKAALRHKLADAVLNASGRAWEALNVPYARLCDAGQHRAARAVRDVQWAVLRASTAAASVLRSEPVALTLFLLGWEVEVNAHPADWTYRDMTGGAS